MSKDIGSGNTGSICWVECPACQESLDAPSKNTSSTYQNNEHYSKLNPVSAIDCYDASIIKGGLLSSDHKFDEAAAEKASIIDSVAFTEGARWQASQTSTADQQTETEKEKQLFYIIHQYSDRIAELETTLARLNKWVPEIDTADAAIKLVKRNAELESQVVVDGINRDAHANLLRKLTEANDRIVEFEDIKRGHLEYVKQLKDKAHALLDVLVGVDRTDIDCIENTLGLMAEGEGDNAEVYRMMAGDALQKLRRALAAFRSVVAISRD